MHDNNIISVEELSKYGPVSNLNEQAMTLVKQQQQTWEMAGKNFKALSEVQTRMFEVDHFHIQVQHNPGRIRSSSAKTDPHIIDSRPCFLCRENMSSEQKGIEYRNNLLILINPFPIFPAHLTIPTLKHIPQRLEAFFPDMLDLCRYLPGFTVFYNGPECGASAPDHFHFQAGSKGYMPVEKEFNKLKREHAKIIFYRNDVEIFAVDNYLRRFIAIISPDKDQIIQVFSFLYNSLMKEGGNEAMINVLSFYDDEKLHILIFPRAKQRQSHFFETGYKQIIIGPATVEMGGILILPRINDFKNINLKTISEIYDEVTASSAYFHHMIDILLKFR